MDLNPLTSTADDAIHIPKRSDLSFLTLPREIRDEIYINLFLQSKNIRPTNPSEARCRLKDPHEQSIGRQIAYAVTLPHIPSLPLLACCRQIRRETQEILARKDLAERRGATVYELDCMVERSSVWPTCIRLPGQFASVHVLEVDFRFLPWPDGTASHLRFLPIFHQLQRLLHHGPYFHAREGQRSHVYIDLLILSFSTPSDTPPRGGVREGRAISSILERVWEPFIALDSYGLLSGQVGSMRL